MKRTRSSNNKRKSKPLQRITPPRPARKGMQDTHNKVNPAIMAQYDVYADRLFVKRFRLMNADDLRVHYFLLLKNHEIVCDMLAESDNLNRKLRSDLDHLVKFTHPCHVCKKRRAEFSCMTCARFLACVECESKAASCPWCG